MGTITDKDRGKRGHIYNILIRGNGNQVCVISQDIPGVDDNESRSVKPRKPVTSGTGEQNEHQYQGDP